MAFFNTKQIKYLPQPVPDTPGYTPPTPPTPPTPTPGSEPIIVPTVFSGDTKLHLYITNSENDTLNKNLYNEAVINISIKQPTNVLEPIFPIKTDIDLSKYNYAYIESTNRYYYLKSEMLPGGIWNINLNVDALMSHREYILLQRCVIDKQEVYGNMYINDGSYIVQSDEYVTIQNFNSGFNNNGEYILICAGG